MLKRIKVPTTCSINKTIAGFVHSSPELACVIMKREYFDILQHTAIVYCYHLKITSFINTKTNKRQTATCLEKEALDE